MINFFFPCTIGFCSSCQRITTTFIFSWHNLVLLILPWYFKFGILHWSSILIFVIILVVGDILMSRATKHWWTPWRLEIFLTSKQFNLRGQIKILSQGALSKVHVFWPFYFACFNYYQKVTTLKYKKLVKIIYAGDNLSLEERWRGGWWVQWSEM